MDKNINYIGLPEKTGWNSGRALLISQVETEYYVYCDDDFKFNAQTRLDTFVKIIETTGFDLIGGGVGKKVLKTTVFHLNGISQ